MPLRAGPMLGGEMSSWVAHPMQLQVPSLAAFENMLCQLLVKPVIPPDICLLLLRICYDNSQACFGMPPRQAASSFKGISARLSNLYASCCQR